MQQWITSWLKVFRGWKADLRQFFQQPLTISLPQVGAWIGALMENRAAKPRDASHPPLTQSLTRTISPNPTLKLGTKGWVVVGIILAGYTMGVAWLTGWFDSRPEAPVVTESQRLYLLDEAAPHVGDVVVFEEKVRYVAASLEIPPEWLMAVMYTESRFHPGIVNRRGSGAVGLIQFMASTLKDLNRRMGTRYYMRDVKRMTAIQQMELVQAYLEMVQERYGPFRSMTDLYLGVLYPKALARPRELPCYVLFEHPTKAYRRNSGLDENRDKKISVCDLDQRFLRMFPGAAEVRYFSDE